MDIHLSEHENEQVESIYEKILQWCKSHPVAVGVAEMAVGAALITYAIQHGLINESIRAINAISDPLFNNASKIGGAVGGGIGYLAGSIIGSIGIVALGGAIGIPASVVAGGASLILGLAGYTAGDLLHNFLNAVDYQAIALKGSVFLIGLGLLIDGARRCLSSDAIKAHFARFAQGAIRLSKVTMDVVPGTTSQLIDPALNKMEKVLTDTPIALAAGGATAVAVSTFGTTTVFGSSTLGSLAVSLGIVSTPVLPIVFCAGGVALLALTVKRNFF
ncbi:hypothetical protein [Pseudomonas sp. BE134]|uniref:hypothetical protein n=1 Tax=Pseudomonas sp. BE134 TaxID=2817843 RepID=UPI00285ED8AC|nr:hypothetical protein [Pseudomonas sp. BE134]MDR6929353.1 hypothetical protein [Pseudomonas sp. BE134]